MREITTTRRGQKRGTEIAKEIEMSLVLCSSNGDRAYHKQDREKILPKTKRVADREELSEKIAPRRQKKEEDAN